MNELEGEWELVGYFHKTDEIEYDDADDGSNVTEIRAWLQGAEPTNASLEAAQPRAGLQLAIQRGAFRESVENFSELMFDVSGVQVNDYQPMSGQLATINSVAFLVPEGVPEFARTEPAEDIVVRYDDGDTLVCDSMRIVDGMLVRQTSVVTDEIYLERMLLMYRRADDRHAQR
ncbi:hypothetical protein [Roseimaritima ulvae]|uniref:Lipocalin-like domain-containing protein n=1 Tax=Roseimaritima ulvae TaxID=980254 RepID=A0A5B9QY88_9BACT|nr:hypothetical protein [Roseimaritima ulvae]QEG38931.1 hypothetical protein UC8_08910 [Roseimaritima ulvae]